jgi:putative ABC transport system permease protein
LQTCKVKRPIVSRAFAVTLLIAAGLLFKSLVRLQEVHPGFDPRGVLTFQLSLPGTTYAEPWRIGRFFDEAMSQLGQIPGVESAAAVTNLPLAGSNGSMTFSIAGREVESARLPEVD